VSERFETKMAEEPVIHDTRLLGDFAVIYCKGVHSDAERAPLASDGAALGAYGKRVPVVCDECAELLAYAEKRRAYCPKDPKPYCSHCDTHCYSPEMAARMRDVMRYAGPRAVFHGHAVDSVKHLMEGRRARRQAAAPAAEAKEEAR
jgi:hypothetical protein